MPVVVVSVGGAHRIAHIITSSVFTLRRRYRCFSVASLSSVSPPRNNCHSARHQSSVWVKASLLSREVDHPSCPTYDSITHGASGVTFSGLVFGVVGFSEAYSLRRSSRTQVGLL